MVLCTDLIKCVVDLFLRSSGLMITDNLNPFWRTEPSSSRIQGNHSVLRYSWFIIIRWDSDPNLDLGQLYRLVQEYDWIDRLQNMYVKHTSGPLKMTKWSMFYGLSNSKMIQGKTVKFNLFEKKYFNSWFGIGMLMDFLLPSYPNVLTIKKPVWINFLCPINKVPNGVHNKILDHLSGLYKIT